MVGMGRRGVIFQDGREWRLSGLLYADDLVLRGESEEYLRAILGCLKVNVGKNKVMVLGGEEGLECEVCISGVRLEHV